MVDATNLDNVKEELKQIDEDIAYKQSQVDLAADIESLHKDERFKRVILEGYLEVEAERIFALLTTPMGWKRELNENLMDKLGSIRDIKEFFGVKLREAIMLPDEIIELEQYRKEVTANNRNDVIDVEVEG